MLHTWNETILFFNWDLVSFLLLHHCHYREDSLVIVYIHSHIYIFNWTLYEICINTHEGCFPSFKMENLSLTQNRILLFKFFPRYRKMGLLNLWTIYVTNCQSILYRKLSITFYTSIIFNSFSLYLIRILWCVCVVCLYHVLLIFC